MRSIRVEPEGAAALERLCRYLVHPPIALGRLQYDGTRAIYSGRRVHPVTGEASVTLDPLEMLARLCQHTPPPGLHLTRLYGTYANRTRGARARRMPGAGSGRTDHDDAPEAPAPTQCERRRQWVGLIAKVFEVDPLLCPCGATMRVIALSLDPAVIRKILQHRPRPESGAHRPHLLRGAATAPVSQRCD